MQHCDPEDLALLALGEAPDDTSASAHIENCAQCRAEVADLSRVVSVGRSIEIDDQLVSPPPTVWTGIAKALASDRASDELQNKHVEAVTPTAPVVQLAERKPRSIWVPTAIAATLCLIFGGVVGGIIVKSNEGGSLDSPVIVASAALEPVPGGPDPLTTGAAKLELVNGEYVLRVDASGLRTPDGFYEVWMMDPQNAGLVAVGSFNADQGTATFPVPAGLPIAAFNSVDISDEPFDGDPGHSKVSVLRGTLTA